MKAFARHFLRSLICLQERRERRRKGLIRYIPYSIISESLKSLNFNTPPINARRKHIFSSQPTVRQCPPNQKAFIFNSNLSSSSHSFNRLSHHLLPFQQKKNLKHTRFLAFPTKSQNGIDQAVREGFYSFYLLFFFRPIFRFQWSSFPF